MKTNNKEKVQSKKIAIINKIVNVIILIGVIVVSYPFLSQFYYAQLSKNDVEDFNKYTKNIETHEIKQRISLAQAYNESLNGNTVSDPYTKKRLERGRAEYARMLEVHEKIGHVYIPKINEELPIYAGTAESVLQKGVGHLEGTSLPIGGKNSHAVLTAHSGLPKNRLFTDLKDLKIGDNFYITNIQKRMAYRVDRIQIVEPTQFEALKIYSGQDYVTLLTCTPYMVNSHRLLVRGTRIPYTKNMEDNEKTPVNATLLKAIVILSIILILILSIVIRRKIKNRNQKNKLEKNK